MGVVHKNDQMKSYYQISVTGKKWWIRLLFDLIDRAIYNSLVLHNESLNHGKKDLKTFRNELAKDLMGFLHRVQRGEEHPLNGLKLDLWRGISLPIFLAMKVEREWKGDAQSAQLTYQKRKQAFMM